MGRPKKTKKPFPRQGAAELRAAIAREKLSQLDAAEQCKCDPGNFSRILRDKYVPGREQANRIKARFGVATERWDEPARAPKGRAA